MENNSTAFQEPNNELLEFTLSSFITYTNTVTNSPTYTPTYKEQAKVKKYSLLLQQKLITSLYGIHNCSNEIRIWNPGHPKHGNVYAKGCNNRHACPVCTSKYMAKQREHLIKTMVSQRLKGGDVISTVLNQAIPTGQDTALSYRRLFRAWSEMGKSAAFRKLQKQQQVEGYVRILEETHGPKGWFPHFHCVWFFEKQPSQATIDAFGAKLAQLWAKFSIKTGAEGTLAANQHTEAISEGSERSQANYLTKHGYFDLSFDPENPQTELKPFELLEVALVSADADLIQAWLNFETATSGAKRVVMSRNLTKARN